MLRNASFFRINPSVSTVQDHKGQIEDVTLISRKEETHFSLRSKCHFATLNLKTQKQKNKKTFENAFL